MEKLITILKIMNLYAHNCHNLTKGSTFFQDHEFLGEIYAQYDADYDDCVERAIGLGSQLNLPKLTMDAAADTAKLPHNERMFVILLNLENALRTEINSLYPAASVGTQQLIGEISNKSEMRTYKLKQRIGS